MRKLAFGLLLLRLRSRGVRTNCRELEESGVRDKETHVTAGPFASKREYRGRDRTEVRKVCAG